MIKLEQVRQVFWRAIAISIAALTVAMSVLTTFPTSVLAIDNQSNQGMSQSATLVAPEPNFKIDEQTNDYLGDRQSSPQNNYQTQQQGNYYQQQSTVQDKVSAVEETVLNVVKKS